MRGSVKCSFLPYVQSVHLTECLLYIREAKTPKQAWENLKKIFAANTAARKLQLRQELNNLQQTDMLITSYTLKIKALCDALGSINVIIDDDEMVQMTSMYITSMA